MYRSPARPANHSHFIFLDPRAHNCYPDWNRAANVTSPSCAATPARNPRDKASQHSSANSPCAVRNSAHAGQHTTSAATTQAPNSFNHPVVGVLELTYQAMELEDDPGHTLTVYPAIPGNPSDEALKLLALWAATENIVESARAQARG
ncbi:hypothetical protein [Pseudarthrobacter sp. Y6]|uniref:MmyB family transcriptional regulator n=1 Tax=Pseudarthrobacter sp. Y6 TaxID=3418422 RepID=UPI003CF0EAA5